MSRRKGRAKSEETPRHGDAEGTWKRGKGEEGKRGREEEGDEGRGVGK